jgi:hypothetical protein
VIPPAPGGNQQPVAGPSQPRSQPATPASSGPAASVVVGSIGNTPSSIRTADGRGITPHPPALETELAD